jgi:hypothetical protein
MKKKCLVYLGKAGAYQSGATHGAQLKRLALSHQKIRLGWKWLTLGNTLAYYDMAKIAAVKSFTVQVPGGNVIKLFTALSCNFSK